MLLGITSDRGTHFIGAQLQQWARDNDVTRQVHISYFLQTTGMNERCSELLKTKLTYLAPKFTGWVGVLTQAIQLLICLALSI